MKTLFAMVFAATIFTAAAGDTLDVRQPKKTSHTLQLSSPDFQEGGMLAAAQAASASNCGGENRSPALKWSGVPKEAKSLVLTVFDPDAPTGSGFWHWVVFNIPTDLQGLEAGATLPSDAVTLANDGGTKAYTGACPPSGDKKHRYIFTLYAIDSKLDLTPETSPAVLGFNLNGKILDSASTTAYYQR